MQASKQTPLAQAIAAHRAGKLQDALNLYQDAIASDPACMEAYQNLGVLLLEHQQTAAAIQTFSLGLQQAPKDVNCLSNIGNAYFADGDSVKALKAYRLALTEDPKRADIWCNQGMVYQKEKQFTAARESLEQSLLIDPQLSEARSNLGLLCAREFQLEEAIEHFKIALKARPDYGEIYSNLAKAYMDLQECDKALTAYDKAVELLPENAQIRVNRALLLLLMGDYERGWVEHEWRFKFWDLPISEKAFAEKRWQGEDLQDKTLLIYGEQGLGDTINFVRYLKLLKARGPTIKLMCQAALIPLLSVLPEVDEFIPKGSVEPVTYDYHYALMDLPRIFNSTLENLPATTPYLRVDLNKRSQWTEIFAKKSGLNVGFVWRGNPGQSNDHNRSMDLSALLPVFDCEGVNFYSLQKDNVGAAEKVLLSSFDNVHDLSMALLNFTDTAAIIDALDVVITVDTAVAHLAAALNKPVWMLIATNCDWRWGLTGDRTPWYPSMRLFRQPKAGRWLDTTEEIQDVLRRLSAAQ